MYCATLLQVFGGSNGLLEHLGDVMGTFENGVRQDEI